MSKETEEKVKKLRNPKITETQKSILEKMGLKPSKKVLDKLKGKKLYKYNTHRQKITGKKKYDYFEITEIGHSDENIFKFKNLIKWDIKNYDFQEKSREEGTDEQIKWQKKRGEEEISERYLAKDYNKLYMPGDWFRALELTTFGRGDKRKLVYGHLESAQSYVYIQILENIQDEIDKVYPYIYARPYGVSMFEDIEGSKYSRMTDTEKRAAGKEKELEKVEKKLQSLWEKIEVDVELSIEDYSGYTFRKYSDKPLYDHLDFFIIGGLDAAENITFKTFFRDFYERIQPVEVLDIIIKELTEKYTKVILDTNEPIQTKKLKKIMKDLKFDK